MTKILAHLTPAVFLLFSLPAPAATPAPAGYLDASKMPGAPFDPQDATAALKSAIQSRAAKVWVPNMGVPWLIDTIWLTSNQEILLENGVVIESRPGKAFHGDGQLL